MRGYGYIYIYPATIEFVFVADDGMRVGLCAFVVVYIYMHTCWAWSSAFGNDFAVRFFPLLIVQVFILDYNIVYAR